MRLFSMTSALRGLHLVVSVAPSAQPSRLRRDVINNLLGLFQTHNLFFGVAYLATVGRAGAAKCLNSRSSGGVP